MQQSQNMQASYRNSFKSLSRCPQLVDVPIGDVSKAVIIDYRNLRMQQDGVKPATVNKEVDLVKGMLSRAVEWDILEYNRIHGLKRLPECEKREVDLSLEQAEQLIAALPRPVSDIAKFTIYTGLRKSEVLGLRIEDIRFEEDGDLAEASVVIKGGRRERFLLCPQAVEVVRCLTGKRRQGYVFLNCSTGTRYININKTFKRHVGKLGLTTRAGELLTIHDIRHVFATWLHQAGVPDEVVQLFLGHRDRATTDRYIYRDRKFFKDYLAALPTLSDTAQPRQKSAEAGVIHKTGKNWQGQGDDHIRILPLHRITA